MLNKINKPENQFGPIHIGTQIDVLLNRQRMTKRELGKRIGVSASNAVHLTTRDNVDVRLLQRVGNAMKYNFWKHFPIDDGQSTEEGELLAEKQLSAEKDKKIEELNAKITEMQQQLNEIQSESEPMKTEMRILKIENEYLKDFTEFVKTSLRPSLVRLGSKTRRKSLGSGERLIIAEGK